MKPEAVEFQERLGFSFDEPTRDAVVLAMRWDRIRVPIDIVDVARTVLDNYRAQLRGLPRFGWQAWNRAANFAAQNNVELDDAMAWVDRSIGMNRNFANLRTKALILEKKGNAAEAEKLRADAMAIATEAELNTFGYQLIAKVDERHRHLRQERQGAPQSWNTYDSLAEAYATKGDKKKRSSLHQGVEHDDRPGAEDAHHGGDRRVEEVIAFVPSVISVTLWLIQPLQTQSHRVGRRPLRLHSRDIDTVT